MTPRAPTGRRNFLKTSSSLAAASFVGTLGALQARLAHASGPSALVASPYGPIAPVNDLTTGLPLLKLPPGFVYKSYGWTGDPMTVGGATPSAHDGMAVVRSRRVGRSTELVLVRNHERGAGTIVDAPAKYAGGTITIPPGVTDFPPGTSYPNGATGLANGFTGTVGGGTTNLVFRDGNWVESYPSLGGTAVNCAGGPTPWGTWLTCEETLVDYSRWGGRKHGYVFEVAVDPTQSIAEPIVGMGRFQHEAVAVDPITGFVYLSHDGTSRTSVFFRYEPVDTTRALGALHRGGVLKALKLRQRSGGPAVTTISMLAPSVGDSYDCEWVTIDNPDANTVSVPGGTFPFVSGAVVVGGCVLEAFQKGATMMGRGEGLWYGGGKLYLADTSAGRSSPTGTPGGGDGAVWELDLETQQITCIFAVPPGQPLVGNNADNITVSPKGGVLVCEDGGTFTASGVTYGSRLMGILPADGDAFVFAENNLTAAVRAAAVALGKQAGSGNGIGNEFCGACFSPDGRVLFVNIQTPGITVAISGPWANGPL